MYEGRNASKQILTGVFTLGAQESIRSILPGVGERVGWHCVSSSSVEETVGTELLKMRFRGTYCLHSLSQKSCTYIIILSLQEPSDGPFGV